jgi:hypothetical protein
LSDQLQGVLPSGIRIHAIQGELHLERLSERQDDTTSALTLLSEINIEEGEVEDLLVDLLGAIQDDVIRSLGEAWPSLDAAHELAAPWARVSPDAIRCGFGGVIELAPIAWDDIG